MHAVYHYDRDKTREAPPASERYRVTLPGDDCTGRAARSLHRRWLRATGMTPAESARRGFAVLPVPSTAPTGA